MKKLFNKPNLYVFLFTTLFFIVLGSLFLLNRSMVNDTQIQILTLQRENTINQIETEFASLESLILDIDSYISTQNNNDAALLDFLEDIDDRNDVISSIYFGMPDKRMINSSGFVPPVDFDLTLRTWYLEATASDSIIYTNAFINATNDKVIITLAYAVHNGTTLLGVIGVDVDIKSVSSVINNTEDNLNIYGFLIDNNDVVITHPNLNTQTIQLELADNLDIPIELMSDNSGITDEIKILDINGKIAFSKVGNSDYLFGLFMSRSEINQNFQSFYIISFAILLAMIAIGGSALFMYHFFINAPMIRLIEGIRKIEPNNSIEYRFSEKKGQGFLDARKALNQLLEITNDYQKEAYANINELSLRNQKFNLLLDSALDIVFITNTASLYTEVYGKGLVNLGLTEKDMLNKTHSEVFGDELGIIRDKHFKIALNGHKSLYNWKFRKDENFIHFETIVSPLYDVDNTIIGVVGVTRDITEQEQRYEDMVYISNHDHLTGLYNIRYYINLLEKLDSDKQYPFAVFILMVLKLLMMHTDTQLVIKL